MRQQFTDYLVLLLGAALAALIIVVFFAIALYYGPRPHAAVPQSDTLLFQQYARAIAEGHPYRFTAGEASSTGSTSHLYPWALAVSYLGGSRGDALATSGFAFHAMGYLVFVGLVWLAARRMTPSSAWLGTLLCVLSGQTVFTFLGQTDMGLFMVLSMAAFVAALYEYHMVLGVTLFLAVWCRPEGAILSAVLVPVALLRGFRVERRRIGPLAAAAAGLGAFVLVLLFNRWLTGAYQFQSVAGKGYFKTYPALAAIRFVAEDAATLLREFVLGLGTGGREFYVVPLLGGLLGLAGVFTRDWHRGPTRHAEAWWLLSAAAALGVVSLSDWQGFLHDRHLAWILPVWLIYVSRGALWVSREWRWTRGGLLLFALLLVYQLGGLGYFAAVYARECERTMSGVAFAREAHRALPPEARVGLVSNAGLAYYMPGRTVRNLSGIVSPAFQSHRHFFGRLEWLKHHPEDRFDAWLLPAGLARSPWVEPFLGERIAAETTVAAGDRALVLCRARWDSFAGAGVPANAEALKAVAGLERVGRVDVGFSEDEERCAYSIYTRIRGVVLHPFVATRQAGDETVTDVGEVILGAETFRAQVRAGRELRLVIRTAQTATATLFRDERAMLSETFTFESPLILRVLVNGVLAGDAKIEVAEAEGHFKEVVLNVPADLISADEIEITVGGDHVSFGYWLYQ